MVIGTPKLHNYLVDILNSPVGWRIAQLADQSHALCVKGGSSFPKKAVKQLKDKDRTRTICQELAEVKDIGKKVGYEVEKICTGMSFGGLSDLSATLQWEPPQRCHCGSQSCGNCIKPWRRWGVRNSMWRFPWGYAKNGWFIREKSHLEMDDNWGYPHLWKPPCMIINVQFPRIGQSVFPLTPCFPKAPQRQEGSLQWRASGTARSEAGESETCSWFWRDII